MLKKNHFTYTIHHYNDVRQCFSSRISQDDPMDALLSFKTQWYIDASLSSNHHGVTWTKLS